MFGSKKPSYEKLEVNLRISISRLKLLAKKKNEQSMKMRKEISEYLRSEKFGRARLKTEQIIREDVLIEALEMLELYCDHLLTKISTLSASHSLESDTEQLVASILWASPRISEVKELKTVSNQLTYKFGKLFRSACLSNMFRNVNQKLIEKLEMRIPSDGLIIRYMEEIARSYKIPLKPLKPNTTTSKTSSSKKNQSSASQRHSLPVENFPYVSSNPASNCKTKLEHSKSHSDGQRLSNSLLDIVTSVKTSGQENVVGPCNGTTYLERWLKNLKEV